MKKAIKSIAKIFATIIYLGFSAIWLFFAFVCVSALWEYSPGCKDYEEKVTFVPIGFFMVIVWLACLAAIIIKLIARRKSMKSTKIEEMSQIKK